MHPLLRANSVFSFQRPKYPHRLSSRCLYHTKLFVSRKNSNNLGPCAARSAKLDARPTHITAFSRFNIRSATGIVIYGLASADVSQVRLRQSPRMGIASIPSEVAAGDFQAKAMPKRLNSWLVGGPGEGRTRDLMVAKHIPDILPTFAAGCCVTPPTHEKTCTVPIISGTRSGIRQRHWLFSGKVRALPAEIGIWHIECEGGYVRNCVALCRRDKVAREFRSCCAGAALCR